VNMATLMDNNGYFIPFMSPVTPPSNEIDQELSKQLVFDGSWLPVILGALKVLVRPETYVDITERTAIESSLEGHQLLDLIDDYPKTLYNWHLLLTVDADYYIILEPSSCPSSRERKAFIAVWNSNDALAGAIGIGGQGRDVASGDIVGGDFTVDVYYQPSASKAYTEGSTDCTGTYDPHSGFVENGHHLFSYSGRDNFNVSIDAITLMLVVVTITSDYTCAQV